MKFDFFSCSIFIFKLAEKIKERKVKSGNAPLLIIFISVFLFL